MTGKVKKIIAYVNRSIDMAYNGKGVKNLNISVSLPPLTDKELAELRKHYKTVEPQGFFGYVKFER